MNHDQKVQFICPDELEAEMLWLASLTAFEDEVNDTLKDIDWSLVDHVLEKKDDSFLTVVDKRTKKGQYRRRTRSAIQLAAIFFLAIGIVSSLALLSFLTIKPIRAELVKLMVQRYPEYSHYLPNLPKTMEGEQTLLIPAYIPERFSLYVDHMLHQGEHLFAWHDGEDYIVLQQFFDSYDLFINNGDASTTHTLLNGIEAEIIEQDGQISIIFHVNDTSLIMSSNLNLSECIKIIESMMDNSR